MRYLTKSRFKTAITCPAKLAYMDDSAFANAKNDNEFLKALAEGGHQVGALAKCLFPEGIEIDAIGHDAQVDQTNALLSREEVVLFEAAVRVGRLFIRVDLLRKHGSIIELYEVKAKGFDSREGDTQIVGKKGGITSEFKPHLYDVAFQRHVLRLAFPEATILSFLVMPDQSVVCPEPNLAQRLKIRRVGPRQVSIDVDPSLRDGALACQMLHILPVDSYLDILATAPLEAGGYAWEFAEGVSELEGRLDGPVFAPRLGTHCKTCEFRASAVDTKNGLQDGRLTCWTTQFRLDRNAFERGTVFDLYNFRGAVGVLATGKILLRDLETEDVKYKPEKDKISSSHRQWLQCEESRGVVDGPVAIAGPLSAKLAGLTFPLHFVDFETATPALPFHVGRRPYEQLLFQFSHHRVDADGKLAHMTQYLNTRPGEFPNFDAIRALLRALNVDNGSVIHWWTHERTVLKQVRSQLIAATGTTPDSAELVEFIDSLVGNGGEPGRLVDLGQHVVFPLLFLPGTKGSSSIKKVLPALLALSSDLRARYGAPVYGAPGGIPSLNFCNQTWVRVDASGRVVDPYSLLSGRFNESDLDALDFADEDSQVVADGGAAMVAYGMLQHGLLDDTGRIALEQQLLRYCELDTVAMVMAWEGLKELLPADT